MIQDAKGRRWYLRFTKYTQGWQWSARCDNAGQSTESFFETKALAEDAARRTIQGFDAIAAGAEYWHRLSLRGTHCALTEEDHAAISDAGRSKAAR